MAITKNPLLRYKVLDRCFRNTGKRYFIENLIEECEKVLLEINSESNGISRRQILQDISFMESSAGWNIPLGKYRDGKRIYYRYSDTSFSINNMPLSEIEILQLQSAIQILSQFNGMPQFQWMNELLPKLKEGISLEDNQKSIISFDSNQYLRGIELLGELFNAIHYKKVLSITYQDFKSPVPYKMIIHPYFLKQYNNRWFLFGFNPEKKVFTWNLALDRIHTIEETKIAFVENSEIDWHAYFEDLIGVTKPIGADPIKIKLIFSAATCHYIINKPLHGSQKSKWLDSDHLEITLEIILNYEFEQLLLSFGNNVQVISPESLRTSIKEKLQTALKQYS
ncbi:WYL domain-containing protein [soil metagenome]